MELLLLSNSTLPGKAWLEHALPTIAGQLNGRRSAVFIPFAGVTQTWDDYTAKTAAVFSPMGVTVTGIHSVADPVSAIENAEIVIVGGGNTFQLLKECRERGLLAPMVDVVKRGALYIGWSAGANLACPTIRTTNDMPIVDPNGFAALGLFPLQINPHFTNALPEGHKGETREQRIRELLGGCARADDYRPAGRQLDTGDAGPRYPWRPESNAGIQSRRRRGDPQRRSSFLNPVRTFPGGGAARLSGLPSRRR
ncbi:alpha-aspartyl dipeptidase Peptidase E [Klebsiella michiganensis]|uniref:dipeptidase E n=6 Tax=Bacteria TaxID=2 RepID=A0A7H4PDN4_9ENTR|nr:alpha-aspartyl dipeptidase Peptidase E [Klebsiella michiganensis]